MPIIVSGRLLAPAAAGRCGSRASFASFQRCSESSRTPSRSNTTAAGTLTSVAPLAGGSRGELQSRASRESIERRFSAVNLPHPGSAGADPRSATGTREVAVVTDSTTYLPPRADRRAGESSRSASTSAGAARAPARSPSSRARRVLRAPARVPDDLPSDLPALGRRLPRRLRAPARSRPRHRLDPHRRRPSPAPTRAHREAARVIEDRVTAARVEVVDGPDRLRRPRLRRPRRRPRSRGAGSVAGAGGRGRRARTREGSGDVVLPRHPRVPAQGRPHRRRPGPGRLAPRLKPILTFGTEIAPVGKVRTKKRAMRADDRLPARAARARGQRLDRPARSVPARTPAWLSRPTASADHRQADRCSAPRSAPCSGPTSARGCWSAASAVRPPPADQLSMTDSCCRPVREPGDRGPPARKIPFSSGSIALVRSNATPRRGEVVDRGVDVVDREVQDRVVGGLDGRFS